MALPPQYPVRETNGTVLVYPCPFCGGDEMVCESVPDPHIFCIQCCGRGPFATTAEGAADLWNNYWDLVSFQAKQA